MIDDPLSRPLVTFALATALVLSGCLGVGGPPPADTSNPGTGTDGVGDAPEEDGPDVVEDEFGSQEIPGSPTRVVALEWVYVENLLALGLQPVGVADIEGYQKWVDVPVALDTANVTDVGTRSEPSLEKIASLDPDLIIGPSFRLEGQRDQLQSIAPTLLFSSYPTEDGPRAFDRMENIVLKMGDALDREDRARQVLGDMHAQLNDANERLRTANATGTPVTIAAAFTYEGSTVMRLYTNNSVAIQALDQIGLRNAWDGGFARYGFSTTGLEPLSTVENSTFLYIAHQGDDPFAAGGAWADNGAWTNLTFVEEDRVHKLPGDTWLLGGPQSVARFADLVVDRLTS